MKRSNLPRSLERIVLLLASVGVAVFLTTTLVFGQESPVHGTIKVERGADLQALTKITSDQARDAARKAVPGASVEKVELEVEDGYLVYTVEMEKEEEDLEVLVDAGNGAVLEVEGTEERDGEPEEGSAGSAEQVELPAAVEASFQAAYSRALILGTAVEHKGDALFYEIESRDGAQRRDLLYRPDGTLYEVEEAVEPGQLPQAVQAAADGQIVRAERLMRGDAQWYELVVRRRDGQEHELVLDEGGRPYQTTQ